jgi:hypothetical protein
MSDATTTNYLLVEPEVGASADSWGGKINNNLVKLDTILGAITTAGSANAYTLTSGLSLSAYVSGQSFIIKANFTNSGAATLNVDGLGAKSLVKAVSTAVASGDIVSGKIYRVAYDGTNFQVQGTFVGDFQAADATLTALAALSITSDTYIRGTGTDAFAVDSLATVAGKVAVGVASLTTDSSPDTAADYLMTYDASASAGKKVTIDTVVPYGSQADMETATSNVKAVTPGRVVFNPGVSKAWVSFQGTGTVTILASMNVSSITDNGTGDYTVNFTTAFSSAAYAVATSVKSGSAGATLNINTTDGKATGSVRLLGSVSGSGATDFAECDVICMGDR